MLRLETKSRFAWPELCPFALATYPRAPSRPRKTLAARHFSPFHKSFAFPCSTRRCERMRASRARPRHDPCSGAHRFPGQFPEPLATSTASPRLIFSRDSVVHATSDMAMKLTPSTDCTCHFMPRACATIAMDAHPCPRRPCPQRPCPRRPYPRSLERTFGYACRREARHASVHLHGPATQQRPRGESVYSTRASLITQ